MLTELAVSLLIHIREGEERSKDVHPPWMIKRDMVEKVPNLEITRQGFKYWLPHVLVKFI